MLYEGSELLGAKGLFKLHCSQHPSGTCSERKILEQCGLLIGSFFQAAAVGLKAATLSQPLDISQNQKFFNATYFSKNAKIV